ncbi:MAG: type II toxin-antitoxin system VapC family toxin [Nitrococcus sp.]|nr:type II toxin-antitoxin system VapC family toxin [Nitrococcus sp.]
MRRVILDTGPIVALFDRDDSYHPRALDWIRELGAVELITTAPVVTEAMYVLPELRMTGDCLDWLSRAVSIDNSLDQNLLFIRDFMDRYGDLPADFADASIVAVCRRLKCTEVATVDSEFDVYRLPDKRQLHNVFF